MWLEKWTEELNRYFPKRTSKQPPGTWEDVKITNHQGHSNKNHNEIITSHLLGWLLSRRQETTDTSKDMVKMENFHTHWQSSPTIMENNVNFPEKKIDKDLSNDSANHFWIYT